MTLSDLISKLEGATEGSGSLDWDIAEATGWPWAKHEKVPPRYSRSVDAALTLVPDGLSWAVRLSGFKHHADCELWDPMKAPPGSTICRVNHEHGSAPIAIVLASLKSRSV